MGGNRGNGGGGVKFEWLLLRRTLRHFFFMLVPWALALGVATLALVVLFSVVMEAGSQREYQRRRHLYSVTLSTSGAKLPFPLAGWPRVKYRVKRGAQTFFAYVLDFKRAKEFFPYLQLQAAGDGVVVGHALYERLHLAASQPVLVGSSPLKVLSRMDPLGTHEDDVLWVPAILAAAFDRLEGITEWLVETPLEVSQLQEHIPSARIESLDDSIRSEYLYWKMVEGFLWLLGGGLVLLTLLFTYLSGLKLIQMRRAEFALLFALGVSFKAIRRRLQREGLLVTVGVTVISVLLCRLLWDNLSTLLFRETILWRWESLPVAVVPITLVTLIAFSLSVRSVTQENLILAIQGGREAVV